MIGDAQLPELLRAAHRDAAGIDEHRIDWPATTRAAVTDWLGGILLQAVDRHRWTVPKEQLMQLRWQALQIRRSNLRLMRCLDHAARVLKEQSIEVLALKGAALNLTLYDQGDLRPMSDLDLMVRSDDATRSVEVLELNGYRRGHALVHPDFFPRFHYETELETVESNPIRIDLHARPFRPMRCAATLPDNALWEWATSVAVDKGFVRIPVAEEQLIHLAAHSAFHGHDRLLWMYDLCRLIDTQRFGINWDRVVETSRRFELVLPLHSALRRAADLWPGLIPVDALNTLAAHPVGWREHLSLFQAPRDAYQPIRHVAVNFVCAAGWRFRCQYLIRVLLPSAEHMAEKYGKRSGASMFLTYAWRGLRAASRVVLPQARRRPRVARKRGLLASALALLRLFSRRRTVLGT